MSGTDATSAERDQRQRDVVDWVRACFGDKALDPRERGRRFAEEAIELCQVMGVTVSQLHDLIAFIYARAPGMVSSEIGGVGVSLLGLADALGFSADRCERSELTRLGAHSAEYWRERQKLKSDAGLSIVLGETR